MTRPTPGSLLAKGLGIDPRAHKQQIPDDLVDRATTAISPFDKFLEDDPIVKEWILEHVPTKRGILLYLTSFFPFVKWIGRYNVRWLTGDLIAGTTLALVMIPQALSYALLANLSPEYGLYTSLVGTALYWLFGTSKDVAIGATAVVSLLVGKTNDRVFEEHPEFTREEITKAHAFLAGCIMLAFGLLRLDWLIEFIPHVAISAFITAAAVTITISQVPNLLGITGINTRGPAYEVAINCFKSLPRTRVDAAIGLTSLLMLFLLKWFCEHMGRRQPHRAKLWSTLCSLRFTVTIVLYILVAFLVNRGLPLEASKFRLLGHIPRGFTHAGAPKLNGTLVSAVLPDLPATVIILVIEHIAIGKSFGRINNYKVTPSQEIIAISATNMLGPFVGAYASTGSFGGSAIYAKAGVRTPFAGVFTSCLLAMALYVLTVILYYIPMASLAAMIMHAVLNLVTSPEHVYKSWLISPPDGIIFFVGVLVSIFTSLEDGIYVTVALSLAVLLLRLARSHVRLMGRVQVHRYPTQKAASGDSSQSLLVKKDRTIPDYNVDSVSKSAFLPLDRADSSNPAIAVKSPSPGVFIYRFAAGFNYLNQAQHIDHILEHVTKETRRTKVREFEHPGDLPWNERHEKKSKDDDQDVDAELSKPTLGAVILDFSAVHGLDSGAVEGLMSLRAQLDRWAAPDVVEWHFAHVGNRWTRRALAVAGFGYPARRQLEHDNRWEPVFALAEKAPSGLEEVEQQQQQQQQQQREAQPQVVDNKSVGLDAAERGAVRRRRSSSSVYKRSRLAAVYGVNRPNFHIDLEEAVEACERVLALRRKQEESS